MSYSSLTGAVEAFRNGDQSAFKDVYDGSSRYIYYTILKSVQDKDIADDILQETYIEIFKNISSLKEPEAFKGWAAVIAQNKISRYFRKKSDTIFSSEEEMDSVIDGMEADDTDMLPEDAADNMETQHLIMDIINTLPEAQKAAVISFYYNQMSINEISTAMEVPENTVKTWLSRGKKKIKDGVLELEKKHGTKLYALPFMVVISGLFSKEAEACELPAGAYAAISAKVSSETAAGAAATGAVGKAGTAAAATAAKAAGINWGIIAAVVIGVGIIGAGTAAVLNMAKQENTAVEAVIDNEEEKHNEDGKQLPIEYSQKTEDASEAETKETIKETEKTEESVETSQHENTDEEVETPEEEIPEADEEAYQIPEVISKLERQGGGMYTDLFLNGNELSQIYSEGSVIDKGDYYEIPEVYFWFYDPAKAGPEDDFPVSDEGYAPVTVRIRKSAVVIDTRDYSNPHEMTAEEYYSQYGKFSTDGFDAALLSCSQIEFDNDGYLIKFSNYLE